MTKEQHPNDIAYSNGYKQGVFDTEMRYQTIDTPEATGFVKALMNEKIVVDFLINEGWVKQIGNLAIVDILREEIVKLLNAKDQEKEEVISKRNAIVKEYKEENMMFILKVEDGKTYEASMPIPKWGEVGKLELREALPTEDNK